MYKERRTETRETLAVPLALAQGGHGVTRDISASGLYFETDQAQLAGSLLDLEFTLDGPVDTFRFLAKGRVVRHELIGNKHGVALQLIATQMKSKS